MQNDKSFESLLPPVPESYRTRMENALLALPVDSVRAVPSRGFTKKQLIVLIAALITLLTVGTAFAIGISRMQEVRDDAQKTIANYQSIVNGSTDAAETADFAQPTPYVIMAEFNTNETGDWQPEEITNLDVSQKVGEFTIRLSSLLPNYGPDYTGDGNFTALLYVNAAQPQPYTLENLRLSVNGGEPIRTVSDIIAERHGGYRATPEPFHAEEWHPEKGDGVFPCFALSGNPLLPGTTFEITGTLNGEPFSLFYDFSREAYEALRAEKLDLLEGINEILSGVPEDTIPVNASMRGEVIDEIALKDHFLYAVMHFDAEYCADPNNPRDGAYEEYDSGIFMTVDGMLSNIEFVSGTEDENGFGHGLYYAYYPYGDSMPDESLIGLWSTVFRVNWKTKQVTVPKDEAEYVAWRKESMELSAKYHQNDYLARPEEACGAFKVKEMIYLNKSAEGQLAVILETDEPVKDAQLGRRNQPVVTVNGTTLVNETCYVQTPDNFEGGSKNGGKLNGFWLYCPAYCTLPDTFEVTISWRGDSVTFTMHKSDFETAYVDTREYKTLLGF